MRPAYSIYVLLTILGLGCVSSATAPSLIPLTEQGSARESTHIPWGSWAISLDPESGRASAVPIRDADFHVDVTSRLEPPYCDTCLQIIISAWDPAERVADITMVLKNPTNLTGYDVKAIISDYDLKEFLKPDAWADFYTDGTTWDPYYIFAEDEPDHAFEAQKSHAVGFQVRFPHGANAKATLTVDASWPDPQPEPWRIDNVVVAGPLQNDKYHHISFICHIRDLQNDLQAVFVDLAPIGPPSAPMGDDSLHKDFLPNDGIWGLDDFVTDAPPGLYDVWIRAMSIGSEHYTYQKLQIEVIPPVPDPPPLYIVSMMHAEEQPVYLNETAYLEYAQMLRDLMQLFNSHGAKIALQPDWTFIQGTVSFDPTLFADFQASGHGVDAHAHETQYDLGQVHDMLDAAGVVDTIIANGGFDKTVGEDGNWAAYVAGFTTSGGQQMFAAAVGYKDPATQNIDSLYTPMRPSVSGDWMVHDPDGPLVYIPGAPDVHLVGSDPNFFILLPQAVDYAIAGIIPDKVNCFYWHDPVGLYDGSPLAQSRLDFWKQVFTGYFDKRVSDGDVIWVNFNEMYQLYLDWEAEHDH